MAGIPIMQPQNFSIPAGYNEVITFDVDPIVTPTLASTTVWWRVWEEALGIPVAGSLPLIEKSSLPSPPGDILLVESPLSFTVQLYTTDTLGLLRNYYHEATILNAANEVIGGSFGIMTVTATVNRW